MTETLLINCSFVYYVPNPDKRFGDHVTASMNNYAMFIEMETHPLPAPDAIRKEIYKRLQELYYMPEYEDNCHFYLEFQAQYKK